MNPLSFAPHFYICLSHDPNAKKLHPTASSAINSIAFVKSFGKENHLFYPISPQLLCKRLQVQQKPLSSFSKGNVLCVTRQTMYSPRTNTQTLNSLCHIYIYIYICVCRRTGHHRCRWWLVCTNVDFLATGLTGTTLKWNYNRNWNIFFQEN